MERSKSNISFQRQKSSSLTRSSLRQSVRDDMNVIKLSPLIKEDMKVLGFVYDITHGTVDEVSVD